MLSLVAVTVVVAGVLSRSQFWLGTPGNGVGVQMSAVPTESTIRGEVLLSENPRIVLGGESPPPLFDPSHLGREAPLSPVPVNEVIEDMVRWQRVMPGIFQEGPSEIGQILIIGTTPGGVHAYEVILEQAENPDERQRCTLTVAAELGTTCRLGSGRDLSPNFVTSLGEERAEDGLTWAVFDSASVVMLSINGERMWQRPVGRVAVFDVALRVGDEIQLVAFDTEGDQLTSRELIAGID